jgi:cyclopropane fatty-acyl-phospholipid synthase-like methyltransferase
MPNDATITTVPLYTHTDRIACGLAARGIGPTDPITPQDLYPLDQWHYHGATAVQDAATRLGLGPSSRVLEIGAGVGGPARCLAHTTGCQVTALELQPELNAIGTDLTRRCGLAGQVTHLCGDALQVELPAAAFDAVVSWLAILHIPDRPRLCTRVARALRPGGTCAIEDLTMRAPFSAADLHDLRQDVFGVSVTSIEDYAADLRAAGLTDIVAEDVTADWAPFAIARWHAWRADRAAVVHAQGEGAYAAQERFYAVIAQLYASGSLGGVRLTARAPA